MLESNYCFDAEHYLDEIEFEEMLEFREEQRGTPDAVHDRMV